MAYMPSSAAFFNKFPPTPRTALLPISNSISTSPYPASTSASCVSSLSPCGSRRVPAGLAQNRALLAGNFLEAPYAEAKVGRRVEVIFEKPNWRSPGTRRWAASPLCPSTG
jgi:hypothetical protein